MRITSSTRRTAAVMAAATIGLSTLVLGVSGVASASTISTNGPVTLPPNTCSVDWRLGGGSGADAGSVLGGAGSWVDVSTVVHPDDTFSVTLGHSASGHTGGAGHHSGGTGVSGGGGGGSTALLLGSSVIAEAAGGGGAGTAAGGAGDDTGSEASNTGGDTFGGGDSGEAGGAGGTASDGIHNGSDSDGGVGADAAGIAGAGGGGSIGGGSGAGDGTDGGGGGGGLSDVQGSTTVHGTDIGTNAAGTDGSVTYTAHDCAVPAAPEVDTVTAGEGSAAVDFWPADVDDDAPLSTVTGWKYSVDGGSTWHALPTTQAGDDQSMHTGTISGLTNGHTYSVAVRATSTSGDGAVSNAEDVTPQHLAAAPSGFAATVGEATVHLTWSPPAGETGITGYQAWVIPGDGPQSSSGMISCPGMGADARSCDITVTPGLKYTAGVAAVTDARGHQANVVTDVVPALSSPPAGAGAITGADGAALSNLTAGQSVTLTGSGYAPYSTVSLYVYSTPILLATVQADQNGAFRTSVTLPAGLAPGAHHLVSAGVDVNGNVRYLRTDVTVATASNQLAWTGFETLPWVGAGVLAVALGAGLVLVGRRRRIA